MIRFRNLSQTEIEIDIIQVSYLICCYFTCWFNIHRSTFTTSIVLYILHVWY